MNSIKNPQLVRSFQKEAVTFLEKKNGTGLLALEMGLGKTLSSLIYTTKHSLRTLVICPNSVKYVWYDEINKWTKNRSRYIINATDKKIKMGYDYTIVNYDIIHKFFNCKIKHGKQYWKPKERFVKFFKQFDCVILDESHYIKSTKARRSKVTKKIDIPKRILLTGTPLTNKPLDLWNQLNYLDEETWNNWIAYRDRYISGYRHPRYGFFIETGTKNIDKLSKRIIPYVFRKRKKNVLKELPPKIYSKISSKLEGKYLKMYSKALQDFYEFLQEFTDLNDKEIWKRLRAEAFTKVMTLKQICSNYKIKKIIKPFVKNILESNPEDKIVLFSQYRKVAIKLSEMFTNSVLIYGDIDTEERAKRIEKFQKDESTKIFIGTLQTSGVGITLTKANHIVFCDLPWTPADLEQAIDRSHRFGQDNPVNIYYLILNNSIENKIYKLLEEKRSLIDQILDGKKIKRKTNIQNDFLKGEIKKAQKKMEF